MAKRTIETEADIRAGVRALRRACPRLRRVHDIAGDPPLRRTTADFEGLARIIVGQQLSIPSAEAIWRRVTTVHPLTPEAVVRLDDGAMRGMGLSRAKIRTLRATAAAVVDGRLDFERLSRAADAEVHRTLIAVSGIGPWTADIYVMFCIGRADAFAAGDLALRCAAGRALDLGMRPSPTELLDIAERWRPWRGVAARLLWAYSKIDSGRRDVRRQGAGKPEVRPA